MTLKGIRPTRKMVRRALFCVIIVTAFGTGVALFTSRSGGIGETPQTKGNSATLTLDKMRHTATRQGVDEWSVEADTVNLFNTEKRAVFYQLKARYFEKTGKITVMTADQGILNTETRDMEVSGNVVVIRGPITIESDTLTYRKKAHTISSKSPVVISDGISTLTGDTMHMELNAGTLDLDGNVTGTFREESKGKTDETSLR